MRQLLVRSCLVLSIIAGIVTILATPFYFVSKEGWGDSPTESIQEFPQTRRICNFMLAAGASLAIGSAIGLFLADRQAQRQACELPDPERHEVQPQLLLKPPQDDSVG